MEVAAIIILCLVRLQTVLIELGHVPAEAAYPDLYIHIVLVGNTLVICSKINIVPLSNLSITQGHTNLIHDLGRCRRFIKPQTHFTY